MRALTVLPKVLWEPHVGALNVPAKVPEGSFECAAKALRRTRPQPGGPLVGSPELINGRGSPAAPRRLEMMCGSVLLVPLELVYL